MKHEIVKLKSGLTLGLVDLGGESLTVLTMVHAGSRDERPGEYGVAHFLEHFVFKGSRKYPKVNDITAAIDGIGGKMNAFTWNDYTGYWVKVASDQWATGVDVVSQLVCEPLLPERELKKEKGTIIEEIKMYEDNFPAKAMEEFDKIVFPDSGLGRPVIGSVKSITDMKIEDLQDFRNRWYFPENIIVVVAGDLSKAENWEKIIEEKFSALPAEKREDLREGYGMVFTQDKPRVTVTEKKTEQAHIVLGMRAFEYKDSKNYTLWVLNQLLGANMSSRLWNEIREKRGLAYYVRSMFYSHFDQGAFLVRAGVRLDKVDLAIKVIKKELLKLTEKPVGAKELQMAKEGAKGNLKLDIEDSQEVATMISDDFIMTGKVRTVEEMVKGIDGVSITDIQEVAKELFKTERVNLSVVGPMNDKERFEKILEVR